jgi:hypothetical protein
MVRMGRRLRVILSGSLVLFRLGLIGDDHVAIQKIKKLQKIVRWNDYR